MDSTINNLPNQEIIEAYHAYLNDKRFPCIGAKAAVAKQQLRCMVADSMYNTDEDQQILDFLYQFVEEYRKSKELYFSATVIFKTPEIHSEEEFDHLLWKKLQSFANLDALHYAYDKRVNDSPHSAHFSFSLKEEAFFIIGLNSASSRETRRFKYPALVFNPHAQFELLRETDRYQIMKDVIRKRDLKFFGSVNPALEDFGTVSEVYQYSGKKYDESWACPLNLHHGKSDHHPTS